MVVLMGSRGPVYLPRGRRTPKTRVSLFGRSWYTSVCYTPYACNQSKRRGKRALGWQLGPRRRQRGQQCILGKLQEPSWSSR